MPTLKRAHRLLKRLHHDERGALTIETVLIIAAIALPVLIIIIKLGLPPMKKYFFENLERLGTETENAYGS